MDKIIFVTAYKDIGRQNWSFYQRTNKEYINYFLNLANNIDYKLIVFIDSFIDEEIKKYSFKSNIIFYDISNVNTFLNKHIEKEKEIMNSSVYQSKIPNSRRTNPEHWSPEYTLINHSKINFISYVKNLYPNYEYYSWLDFGCIRNLDDIPKNIDLTKLENNKITYLALDIPDKYISANSMLALDDIYITGSMFIIHCNTVQDFETLYEKIILDWQTQFICDDDQSLILQLYFIKPQIFNLVIDNEWFSMFRKHLNTSIILKSRGDFHTLLNYLQLHKKYIEIGVARGDFSNYLLEHTGAEKLYLVDPYQNFNLEEYTDAMNNYNMEYEYQVCQQKLQQYSNRIQFIRKTSSDAIVHFDDESIDFVYIDGNHCYKNVYEDLDKYWKKIKPGGILAGDDYYDFIKDTDEYIFWDNINDINKSISFGKYGVVHAVKDFCQTHNLKYYHFSNQFYMFKI